MQVRGSQLQDQNGKKYPVAPSATTTAKVFTQATAPSGVGEAAGDIWFQT